MKKPRRRYAQGAPDIPTVCRGCKHFYSLHIECERDGDERVVCACWPRRIPRRVFDSRVCEKKAGVNDEIPDTKG
jgi:hypothetical protein